MDAMNTIRAARQALLTGTTSARALTEHCLAAIGAPGGEGPRTFIKTDASSALANADAIDALRQSGAPLPPFAGIPISIKDLFDVEGEVTTAGSVVLKGAKPAAADAIVIARLRAAGFIFIGRTNMTEFAYSGVGLNPHYGTPRNPYDRVSGRIPGGSSSGAAISVTDGMALAGLGTDTGGSCRIPAALTGLVGWKPTAARVPCEGVLPLSPSLDSVGWLARSVDCCALLDAVAANDEPVFDPPPLPNLRGLKFAVPQTLVFDDITPAVSAHFEQALTELSKTGAHIVDVKFSELEELPQINAKGGFPAVESYSWHRKLLETGGNDYDPRVKVRILRGLEQSNADYVELQKNRARLIDGFTKWSGDFDALILPTVPIIAPRFDELEDDLDFSRINALLLRNPSIANFLDLCAISIPCHKIDAPPVGLMIMAGHGQDANLLHIASAIERKLDACRSAENFLSLLAGS
jgi:aspartyl-tRNA(Asn)/glutamyl-tRNA(Gln) amidotransferase subunit A